MYNTLYYSAVLLLCISAVLPYDNYELTYHMLNKNNLQIDFGSVMISD